MSVCNPATRRVVELGAFPDINEDNRWTEKEALVVVRRGENAKITDLTIPRRIRQFYNIWNWDFG